MTHFHICCSCGDQFECNVEDCADVEEGIACDDCAANEDDGLTNDYIEPEESEDEEI